MSATMSCESISVGIQGTDQTATALDRLAFIVPHYPTPTNNHQTNTPKHKHIRICIVLRENLYISKGSNFDMETFATNLIGRYSLTLSVPIFFILTNCRLERRLYVKLKD